MLKEPPTGIYIEEFPSGIRSIQQASTAVAAFVGSFKTGPVNEAVHVTSFHECEQKFGGFDPDGETAYAVYQFFQNGGTDACIVRTEPRRGLAGQSAAFGNPENRKGLYALDKIASFNMLNLPELSRICGNSLELWLDIINVTLEYCVRRKAFLLIDPPDHINNPSEMARFVKMHEQIRSPDAALFFPKIIIPDPSDSGMSRTAAPGGTLAGLIARNDIERGVWKAPAGVNAQLRNVLDLDYQADDDENVLLNSQGVNCLRFFPEFGICAWGARTLMGSDEIDTEWKYIHVRRLALFLERSLTEGIKWAVFEPNAERTWFIICKNVEAFLNCLWRQGAFTGTTSQEGFYVKCGHDTMTTDDILEGRLILEVGFAPLKPAEFIVFRIQQRMAE